MEKSNGSKKEREVKEPRLSVRRDADDADDDGDINDAFDVHDKGNFHFKMLERGGGGGGSKTCPAPGDLYCHAKTATASAILLVSAVTSSSAELAMPLTYLMFRQLRSSLSCNLAQQVIHTLPAPAPARAPAPTPTSCLAFLPWTAPPPR
eukprot:758708-Hanusia_phi.AAC.8